jgi:hypothetical protein
MDVLETVACLNCGHPLTGLYCAGCGQKRHETDPTLRELLHETTSELLEWDGKIPSTLKTLFFRPGVLTLDFLAGRRARWLLPLRLYLLCSIAYFVSKPVAEAISHRAGPPMAQVVITNPDGTTALTPEALEELGDGWPARVFGRERLIRAVNNNAELNQEINAIMPKAMFILLPAFAFLTMLVWRRRLPRYPAHLYLALHLHSAWFGALAVFTIVQALFTSEAVIGLLGVAVLVYVVAYALLAARRIFGDGWLRTIAKAAVVFVAYARCLSVVSLALLGYVLTKM